MRKEKGTYVALENMLRVMDERGHEAVTFDREQVRRLLDPSVADFMVRFEGAAKRETLQ